MMLAASDLIFTASGWVLGAAGLLLVLWALLWDRSRGRRRCPKCWYDMVGVPGLVCPECGRDVKEEKGLFKTRRRWRWAMLAGVVLAGSWVVGQVPVVRQGGWWAAAPRPVLIAMVPHAEHQGVHSWNVQRTPFIEQLESRLFGDEWELAPMWWPERRWLANRARRAVLATDSPDYTRALGSRALVLTRADPLHGIPEERQGPVILARTALTYVGASTYRDRGVSKGDIGVRNETHFLTALVREGVGGGNAERRFRFEHLNGHPHERHLSMRSVIWANGDRVKSWWTVRPQVQEASNLLMPIAAATGVSSGTALRINRVLVEEMRGGARSIFTDLEDVTLIGIEPAPDVGVRCYRISAVGTLMGRTTYDLWIDTERFLLLRFEEQSDRLRVTTYEPEVDVEIDESWFEFDPDRQQDSPLQDPDPPASDGRRPRR